MKFPNFKMNKWFTARAFVLLAGLFLMALAVPAQKTEANPAADLVAIARGAGIANSTWAADEAEFDRLVTTALKGEGPNLIAVRIDEKPAVATTDRDPVQIRERFMRGLGVKSGAA